MGHAGGECAYAQLTDLANDLRRRRPLANSSDSSPIFQGLDTCMQSSPNKVIGRGRGAEIGVSMPEADDSPLT
ncbi:predicted protein [Botrytis cinerea T4]|uniref:Uncharacterized protein n=1 Tax=Botryotinia fuckeliana (strain T4) TaxID=999810 RepID=G2XRH8_BOTF4|nr:predicted protein [Botrytis cinerea T4]